MVNFRKGNKRDIQPISEIEKEVFGRDLFSIEKVEYLLTQANATTIVADENGVVGYAIMLWRRNSSKGNLCSIAVKPENSGKGIGRTLLNECENEARKRKCSAITLEVRVDNDRARNLYASIGYEEEGIIPRYYADGTDGIRMEKEL